MLPEMARQALNLAHQLDQHHDSRRFRIDAAALEQRDEIVVMVAELVHLVELGEPVNLVGRKAERLADLAHRAPRAIGDHVRGHRGAAFAVAAIDVLNRHLAIVAAGQVEIDVGPFAALLGKKTLEQQFHLDRIHRRDSERVTHRAVGRGAASLHHDPILAAELDDVPHDQEVAGEFEPLDDPEFVFELAASAIVHRAAPSLARACIGEDAQIAVGRFVRRQRIIGKAIAHVAELEIASFGDRARGGDGAGQIAKQRGHLGRRFQMALAVDPQRAAGFLERGLEPDAGQHVEQPAIRAAVAYVVGRDNRDSRRVGQRCELAIEALLAGVEMTLQIDVEIFRAENPGEPPAQLDGIFAANQHARQRAHHAAAKADQSAAVAFEFVERDAALAFGGIDGRSDRAVACVRAGIEHAHLRVGDHAAEILVALAIRREDVEARVVVERQLRADDLPDTRGLGGQVKARRAVNSVAIAQRHRAVAEFRRARRKILGRSRAFKKAESTARAKFDIIGVHSDSP